MSINHQLKNCLFNFLSNKTFTSYEFKDLRVTFINCYPEFSSKRYYAKIYQLIRELASAGLILIDSRNCTYKYSSNYSKDELSELILPDQISQIQNSLNIEQNRVIKSMEIVNTELSIYQLYLAKFPALTEVIIGFINKKEKEMNFLQCELNALKTLIEAN